jgi:hypothetical protein
MSIASPGLTYDVQKLMRSHTLMPAILTPDPEIVN